MKYIINTGCSYGVMFRSFGSFVKSTNDQFRIIDLHCDSHGSEYQKRSIIYAVDQLLLRGVLPTDIFVIVEWSQPNRLFTELPREFSNYILLKKDELEPSFFINNSFKHTLEDSFIPIYKYKSLCTIFGDRIYINPEVDDVNYINNPILASYIEKYKKNSIINDKPIDRMERYLQNILDLQNYLVSNKIDYSYFLMNNTFTGYSENFVHDYTKDFINIAISNDIIKIPKLQNNLYIKDFSSYLNSIWNQIDFTKFAFYQTDTIEFGGIDEYAMERFGHVSYYSSMNEWDKTEDKNVAYFGSHPHDSVYIDFFREYIYERVYHIIGDLTFNMNNRWSANKHNFIRNTLQ